MSSKNLLFTALFMTILSARIMFEDSPLFPEPETSGLVQLDGEDDIFYWMFPSRANPDKDPLIF